jgi:hypothetical protein
MTTSKPSRATLESLLALIDGTDWPYLVKRDAKSSVRTVARFIGADMADIEADVPALRRRLEGLSPEAFGLTKGRWNNIRSLFGKALGLAVEILPSSSKAPVLQEWDEVTWSYPREGRGV